LTLFQASLNNIGQIYKRLRTPDGQGGWAISYIAGDVANCRMRPANSAERTVAQQEQRKITHVLYVELDTDIERGDRFAVDGITVDVDALRKPSRENNWLSMEHLEMDCLEVQQENVYEGS
jgi:SPP1 family predicted phage head-tail adaptor